MRQFNALVFDEFISGQTMVFTSAALDDRLGKPNQLSLFAVADNVSGTAPTLSVQIYTSADGRNFVTKSQQGPEINTISLSTGATNVATGYDQFSGSLGSFGYVRLGITLGGTNPAAHVKIYVTGRDND